MTCWRITTVGPSLVAIVEYEGITRLFSTARNDAEEVVLDAWIGASWPRQLGVAALLEDRTARGGIARQEGWRDVLGKD
jgi:hypothetical protein